MLVTEVIKDGPAEKAGLISGDVILELNGKKLVKSSDLVLVIANSAPNTVVKLKILRDGKNIEKNVTLGDRSDFSPKKRRSDKESDSELFESYGMKLSNIDSSLRKEYEVPSNVNGVIIVGLDSRGTASYAGLKEGDVIYKINNKSVATLEDIKNILKDTDVKNYFFVNRQGREFIVIM